MRQLPLELLPCCSTSRLILFVAGYYDRHCRSFVYWCVVSLRLLLVMVFSCSHVCHVCFIEMEYWCLAAHTSAMPASLRLCAVACEMLSEHWAAISWCWG